jgi:hypothetical protein
MSTIVGTIERINGSLIVAKFDEEPKIGDLTEVGDLGRYQRPQTGGAG